MPIVCIILLIICIGVIIFQLSTIKHLNEKVLFLQNFEEKYNNCLMERAKLEEKCNFLENFREKYEQVQENYLLSEKQNTLLKSNLEQERQNLSEKIKLLENAEQKLSNTFKALSSDVLKQNNQSFLDLAQVAFEKIQEKANSDLSLHTKSIGDMVNPIKQALDRVNQQSNEMEKSRVGAYEALRQQVNDLMVSQSNLKNETNRLVSALKAPTVRGRWGEVQLRRIVELAGMVEHCDFDEQVSFENQGTKIRPDMIIYYPGGKQVIVDAKVPLTAYLKSLEIDEEIEKKNLLREHAKQIRDHVIKLSRKEYWGQVQSTPEFVIMFLPGEIFFSTAMDQDPSLIEFAIKEGIIISTPTTLLALLHTIAWGWRQENLADNAKQIVKMGQEIYKRLSDLSGHFASLGKSISNAVMNYNQTVANLESRVLVTARKFKEIEGHEKNIIELSSIENTVRQLRSH